MNSEIHSSRLFDKKGLAAFFGVSLPTIDNWIAKGAPAIVRGEKGKSWQFDCLAVHDWREGRQEKKGDAFENVDPATLTIAEAKLYYEGMLRRRELEKIDRHLIPAEEFEEALAEACKTIVAHLDSLPDSLEKKGLDSKMVGTVELTIRGMRQQLYDALTGEA